MEIRSTRNSSDIVYLCGGNNSNNIGIKKYLVSYYSNIIYKTLLIAGKSY